MSTLENEQMLETAKRAISELDAAIADSQHMRDVWMKICGKIEEELHGRILPIERNQK